MHVTETNNRPSPVESASGTSVIVLTVIAGFFSFFIGGCTASVGKGLSDLNQEYGSDPTESAQMNTFAENQAGIGLLSALLGIGGGIWAVRKYNDNAKMVIAGRPFKKITLAGTLILVAAALSIFNVFTFITAGVMNAIAGTFVLMRAKNLDFL